MQISPAYILMPSKQKKQKLLSFAMKDAFFDGITHDLVDYGYDLRFSLTGGAGAYKPYALATERLDTPQKQQQFSNGFWSMSESGAMKAQIQLSLLLGEGGNAHSFLHEIMHFHQDMQGLYFIPMKEDGLFPIALDAHSNIVSILFCEAWAQVEAIRTCWALRDKGDPIGWSGAVQSPDWKDLARSYDADLQKGLDEARAAANCFRRWYQGRHRVFYEKHAMNIYDLNFKRFAQDVDHISDATVAEHLRSLDIPALIAHMPKGGAPKFFSRIDWGDDAFQGVKNAQVAKRLDIVAQTYAAEHSPAIHEIKCGSPPYIWKRLRDAEIQTAEVPPH